MVVPTPTNRSEACYTPEQVSLHNSADSCWIIIEDGVYDVTSFLSRHPGGVGTLLSAGGADATDVFFNYHSESVQKRISAFRIGRAVGLPPPPDHVVAFRRLRKVMKRVGMFETDYRYYAKLCIWILFLFLFSSLMSLGFVSEGAWWVRCLGAGCMGFCWQQLAGLGHDLGHSSVTGTFADDYRYGSFLASLMGLSMGWWKRDHNTHHVVCNAIEHDPNIQHLPLLSITEKVVTSPAGFYDTFHDKVVRMTRLSRLLVSYQHLFFYPLMGVARWNLYLQGLLHNSSPKETHPYLGMESLCLCFFFVWMFGIVLAQPTLVMSFAWILLSHGVAGVLHIQIVLSHWTREVYFGNPFSRNKDWYVTQLETTMNITCPSWMDWFHIGLQFQVDHHLFPRVPRHNLRTVNSLVKSLCKTHGLPYREVGFWEANLELWRLLRSVSFEARKGLKEESSFREWEVSPLRTMLTSASG